MSMLTTLSAVIPNKKVKMPGAQLRSILFDLDGTLLDTAPDLAAALNHVLVSNGRQALPFETIRPWVSHGGLVLIKNGFNITQDAPEFDDLRQQLLDFYRNNLSVKTRLFAGMNEVLLKLEKSGIKWGVVTNKPAWLTVPLLDELQLTNRSSCVISGDTLSERKPHPLPLQHACELIGCDVSESLYVGDAQRDIEAGINAKMPTLIALFGYISDIDYPENWGANGLIDSPLEILNWVHQHYDTDGLCP